MEKVYVRNLFQILIPLNIDFESALSAITRTEPFGLDVLDRQCSININLVGTDYFGNTKHEPKNCFTWAKCNPLSIEKRAESSDASGLIIRLKINQGVFDFRRTKNRLFQIIVEFIENGSVTKRGASRIWELFPKRRHAQINNEEKEAVVPIYWIGEEGYLADTQARVSPQDSSAHISPSVHYHDVSPEHRTSSQSIDESTDRTGTTFPHDVMLDEDSLLNEDYTSLLLRNGDEDMRSNESDNYMVLYNGNAEVVGNFRALNFYKASDINIKEDILLLEEDCDCRAALLRIDGMSYKFKPGVSHATNKRFIGYIAQQIESVVPEAVQLIDGILHVDYESLIPYMSESIKQNYNDIQNVTSEVDRIKRVVDALYDQFIGLTERVKGTTAATEFKQRSSRQIKVIGWTIGVIAVMALIMSVVIGYIVLSGLTAEKSKGATVPTTVLTPSTKPIDSPIIDAISERSFLIDLFSSLFLDMRFTENHCEWPGVSCSHITGRVVSIAVDPAMVMHRTPGAATIPLSIGYFTELQILDLCYSRLNSTIPESIKNLKNLEWLNLALTHLVGTVPDLSGSTKLQKVDLYNTSLSLNKSTLEVLMNLPSIERLDIGGVSIDGTLPPQISNSLTMLNLRGCGLHGTIPKSWEDSNIQYLDITYNKLNGSIPCLGKTITKFFAYDNDFDGEFCGTRFTHRLEKMIIRDTKLTGVFDLPNIDVSYMNQLIVSKNQFISFMPSAMNITEGPNFCTVTANPLQCPIPKWAERSCGASCN